MKENTIGLLGDVHGAKYWLKFAAWKFNKEGITKVLQLGDFGFDGTPYRGLYDMKGMEVILAKQNVTLYVTPGNHEDYDYIETLKPNDEGWLVCKPHILVAPRGHRWEWDGVSFVSLGGAPSVDRAWRVRAMQDMKGEKLWWEQEQMTQADIDKTVAGGYADVMVCHDAPSNVATINQQIKGNPHGFTAADLMYAKDGRMLLDQAFKAVQPKVFVHGHYHFRVNEMVLQGYEPNGDPIYTQVCGLGCDSQNFSLGGLDLATKTAYPWDISADVTAYNRGGV